MKKPLYQDILEKISWLLIGLIVSGSFLDGIVNAISIINLQIAFTITISIICVYVVLLILFRKRKIVWVSSKSQRVSISGLGKKTKWSLCGAVVLLWLGALFQPTRVLSSTTIENASPGKPIFDSAESRFSILVLPFDRECEYEGLRYDIGKVIAKRLETLNDRDSLNIIVRYFGDSIDFNKLSRSDIESIMRYHNADQVLYGSYSLKKCEGDVSDKICYNYLIDSSRWNLGEKQFNVQYKMMEFSNMDALREGKGQEHIDHVIYFVAGVSSFENDEFKKAISQLTKINNYVKDDAVLDILSLCHVRINEFQKAKEIYQQRIVLTPNSDVLLNNMGVICSALKEYSKALEYYKKALEIKPGDIEIFENLGNLYYSLNDTLNAKKFLENALALHSRKREVLCKLGSIYLAERNYSKSKACYENALKADSDDGQSWFNLGIVHYNEENYNQAVFCFNNAARIEPHQEDALVELGRAYAKLREFPKAKGAFENAIGITPNKASTWFELGLLYDQLAEDYIKAGECYRRAVALDPSNGYAWFNSGVIDIRFKDTISAVIKFERSVLLNPFDKDMWFHLGCAYMFKNDNQKASRVFEKVVELTPTDDTSRFYLANMYFNVKKYKEAVSQLKILLKNNPGNFLACYFTAAICSVLRDRNNTIRFLDRAISINNVIKIDARKNVAFEWLWNDPQFIEITKLQAGENLSADRLDTEFHFRKREITLRKIS